MLVRMLQHKCRNFGDFNHGNLLLWVGLRSSCEAISTSYSTIHNPRTHNFNRMNKRKTPPSPPSPHQHARSWVQLTLRSGVGSVEVSSTFSNFEADSTSGISFDSFVSPNRLPGVLRAKFEAPCNPLESRRSVLQAKFEAPGSPPKLCIRVIEAFTSSSSMSCFGSNLHNFSRGLLRLPL